MIIGGQKKKQTIKKNIHGILNALKDVKTREQMFESFICVFKYIYIFKKKNPEFLCPQL